MSITWEQNRIMEIVNEYGGKIPYWVDYIGKKHWLVFKNEELFIEYRKPAGGLDGKTPFTMKKRFPKDKYKIIEIFNHLKNVLEELEDEEGLLILLKVNPLKDVKTNIIFNNKYKKATPEQQLKDSFKIVSVIHEELDWATSLLRNDKIDILREINKYYDYHEYNNIVMALIVYKQILLKSRKNKHINGFIDQLM